MPKMLVCLFDWIVCQVDHPCLFPGHMTWKNCIKNVSIKVNDVIIQLIMRYNSKLDDSLFDHKQSKQLTSLCSTTLDPPS